MKIPSLSVSASLLILLVIAIAMSAVTILASIMSVSIVVLSLTFLFSLITGQSYDKVCDSSEILFQLNKYGKWGLVLGAGLLILMKMMGIV